MNTDLVSKWADELDSGNYTQIFGQFFGRAPEYCCAVGVLLTMFKDDPTRPFTIWGEASDPVYRLPTEWTATRVSRYLADRGIPFAIVGEIYGRNDAEHQSFSVIATVLRNRVAEEIQWRQEAGLS